MAARPNEQHDVVGERHSSSGQHRRARRSLEERVRVKHERRAGGRKECVRPEAERRLLQQRAPEPPRVPQKAQVVARPVARDMGSQREDQREGQPAGKRGK